MIISIILNIPDVIGAANGIWNLLLPFIAGLAIAYLLNPLMMFIENRIFAKLIKPTVKKRGKKLRTLSLVVTVLLTVAVFVGIIFSIIKLAENILTIFKVFPSYIKGLEDFVVKTFSTNPELQEFWGDPIKRLEENYGKIWEMINPSLNGFVQNISAGVWALIDALKNVIIGFIISIYFLFSKELFIGQSKKIMFAIFKNNTCQKIFSMYRKCNKIFMDSIIAKALDALIVGLLYFAGCSILQIQYAFLISVIMTLFNLIPYIGALLGAIPCALLLALSENPVQALWFIIFSLVLQNIDGNIINPKIMGGRTGLPSVWVLVSIIIGGGLFQIVGMLLAVPVCAVLYMIIKTMVENKLERKGLPVDTEMYSGSVEHMTADYVYTEEEKAVDEIRHNEELEEQQAEKQSFFQKLKNKITSKRKDNK